MKLQIGGQQTALDRNTIHITPAFSALMGHTTKAEMTDMFDQIRLNLQSRIIGAANDRELIQLQGNLVYLNELEQFFKSMISGN
jgi:hypothetical protein